MHELDLKLIKELQRQAAYRDWMKELIEYGTDPAKAEKIVLEQFKVDIHDRGMSVI